MNRIILSLYVIHHDVNSTLVLPSDFQICYLERLSSCLLSQVFAFSNVSIEFSMKGTEEITIDITLTLCVHSGGLL